MDSGKSWLEISEDCLRNNFRALCQVAAAEGRAMELLAVIKAGGYGHGAELCGSVLASEGAAWMGVTDAEEGIRVRRAATAALEAGQSEPAILVMCGMLPGDAEGMVESRLTPVVWFAEQLRWLAGAAVNASTALSVHLEIDTGMARQGVRAGEDLARFLEEFRTKRELRLGGVFTHFASSERAGSDFTRRQRERFEEAMVQIAAKGFRPDWIHAGNTSTVDEATTLPWLQGVADCYGARSMVRSGLALYGYCLPLEGARGTLERKLKPVLSWKARILGITDAPAGTEVGYNSTFVTRRAMRLALLPVGYADGLRRELSSTNEHSGGWAMCRGRRAPVVGRISMNLTTVDVTDLPSVGVGEEVTLLGPGVTASDHAELAGTIPYEILCGLRAPQRLVR